ncbi:MAG: acyl-CoA dehydrogenase [bacterium]|nr:acyl-CoA dehydrogenase [bacterium]
MELNDSQLLIRDQYRKFMTTELEAATPAMESGAELPFPFIKKMHAELGAALGVEEGDDEETRSLASWARTQLVIEIARVNPGFGLSWGVTIGLCAGNIMRSGTPDQKARYLPGLLSGDKVGCWCLTEPGAGSDAFGSMRTIAKRDGDHYILNGSKTFITNAPYGDIFLVYARNQEDESIQAFIVERELEGLSVGKPFKKMGMKSSPTGEVFFDDVRVPAENLLGAGMRDRDHVRKSLAGERIGIAVMGLGIAERCFEIARDYAKERVQGGHAISNYQLIQNRLARMYVALSNARRFVYEQGDVSILDACAGKLYVAEVGTFVAQEAIHIMGGYGYLEEQTVERLARDAKLLELGGGTTEIQILTIARHILEQ